MNGASGGCHRTIIWEGYGMSVAGAAYVVNLTEGTIRKEMLPEATYRKYTGGSLLAAYLLFKYIPRGADPLGPENVLVFAVSPLTGLPISGQSRMTACACSPLTGGIGDSQCGGFFPAEMRKAGAGAIVFLGRAPSPVYFYLKDGEAVLRPAGHLWGKVTGRVEQELRAELGDSKVQIAQMGPAGENLVRYAAIMNLANRANGRTGMGAVMGSKNLKAVVVRGSESPRPAQPEKFRELVRRLDALRKVNPGIVWFGQYGTAGVLEPQNYSGGLPTRNFNSGWFEGAKAIGGEALYNTVLKSRDTCYACAVRCKRVVEINDPDIQVDPIYGGPEYETLSMFGSACLISDLKVRIPRISLRPRCGLPTGPRSSILCLIPWACVNSFGGPPGNYTAHRRPWNWCGTRRAGIPLFGS